jgi:hypothetical protein
VKRLQDETSFVPLQKEVRALSHVPFQHSVSTTSNQENDGLTYRLVSYQLGFGAHVM